MLEDLGIASQLKARRESFAKRCPAQARRILGQSPVFEPVKTTAIVVDLKTGEKIVKSEDKPSATEALDQLIADRIDAAFSSEGFAREIDRKVSARIQAEVAAIVAKRVEAERREFERVNTALNRVSISVIFETAVAVTGIERDMLASPRRARHLAWPRQFTMWLVKELRPDLSLMAIGAAFNRDHTTVMHAIKMVNERENVAPVSDWLQDDRTKALLARPEAP